MRKQSRSETCNRNDAKHRLTTAKKFAEVADLIASEHDPDLEYGTVAASLIVLAAIAASDAACCAALGKRSRSENHADAINLLEDITPEGPQAAKALRYILSKKDTAHYGITSLSTADLKRLSRQSKKLIDIAERITLN